MNNYSSGSGVTEEEDLPEYSAQKTGQNDEDSEDSLWDAMKTTEVPSDEDLGPPLGSPPGIDLPRGSDGTSGGALPRQHKTKALLIKPATTQFRDSDIATPRPAKQTRTDGDSEGIGRSRKTDGPRQGRCDIRRVTKAYTKRGKEISVNKPMKRSLHK